jgi:Gram-negative bacterial TonB protein C-terminal
MQKRQIIGAAILISCSWDRVVLASPPPQLLTPTVVVAEVPFYPPIGRAASLQGVVVLEVTTEGDKANSIKILRGPKLLADAATSNLRGWRFVGKPPETFQVTYRYRLSAACKGNPAVNLNLPSEVSVCSKPSPPIY